MPKSFLEQINEIIEIEDEINLSNWERGFLRSVREKILKGVKLSMKQATVINNLYDKACDSPY